MKKELLDVKDLSLDDWLALVFNPPEDKLFIKVAFPTDRHKSEYFTDISERDDTEIERLLLNFLIPTSYMNPLDEAALYYLETMIKEDKETADYLLKFQYYKKLVLNSIDSSIPVWEGLTWVLDLLPHFPKQAIEGINSYLLAHAQFLSDWRLNGLSDAIEIIRAKYIGLPNNNIEFLSYIQNLTSREFEHITEALYHALDYETQLTKPQRDGGRDIIAKKSTAGDKEHLLIECKQYSKPVGVALIRALYGVVASEKVNKGVLVTTSHFTKGALKFAEDNPRIELINGSEFLVLLNEHLGGRWFLQIDRYIRESQQRNIKK